jgi:hypothetical protein
MRILIAGLIGGIVMFIWGAVAHVALPLGQIGIKQPTNEDVVLVATRTGLPAEDGVYILPSMDPAHMGDKSFANAYAAKTKTSPFAFVVYQAQGTDLTDMSQELPKQWASDTLAALVAAFVMAYAGLGFGRRVIIAAAMGVFAWLSVSVPYWTWYRFPLNFTLGSLAEQLIGWILAGIAIAWWLGRRQPL